MTRELTHHARALFRKYDSILREAARIEAERAEVQRQILAAGGVGEPRTPDAEPGGGRLRPSSMARLREVVRVSRARRSAQIRREVNEALAVKAR